MSGLGGTLSRAPEARQPGACFPRGEGEFAGMIRSAARPMEGN